MTDYARMARAELVARLRELEAKCQRAGAGNARADHARTALADSEERLRAILATAVEGIITVDERGLIESMNRAAGKFFGYQPEEVIGKSVNLLMPAPYCDEHDRYLADYLRTGRAKIIGIGRETVARRKDGSTFPIDLSVSEVRLADRRLFAGFIRDISERRRLEKEILEISDREQRRIGQDLHDGLCQQLAGIELMSRALEQKIATRSQADAARAGEIAGHVRQAIRQTRLLARGLSPVTLESEGLRSALQELASNTAKIFQVDCRFEDGSRVPVRDQAMITHLFRIAQEAVSNAIKHGKATQILIALKQQRRTIALVVSDDGSGFPRSAPSPAGMGLRIMRSRAGMIGGNLAVENNPEGGARITCTVPLDTGTKQKGKGRGRKNENSESQQADPPR